MQRIVPGLQPQTLWKKLENYSFDLHPFLPGTPELGQGAPCCVTLGGSMHSKASAQETPHIPQPVVLSQG